MADYDCTDDVIQHKALVRWHIQNIVHQLNERAENHDNSKLNDPIEKAMFDHWTPELRKVVFGTDEYKAALDGMGEGVKLHYKANRHHPEHFENGINDMTLVDLIEMLCDWIAAAERRGTKIDMDNGMQRFGMSDQLARIFANTLREYNSA